MAELCARIAQRYEPGPRAKTCLSWPSPELEASLRLAPLVLAVQAHVVQSQEAAASPDDARRILARAEQPDVLPPMRHEGHLKLIGAIGRVRYALGEDEPSRRHLEEALTNWLDIQPDEGARPLCALAWLEATARAPAEAGSALERLERTAYPMVWGSSDPVGRGFVELAFGRAWARVDPTRALSYLRPEEDARWQRLPRHVQLGRERFLITALEGAGRTREAGARRDRALTISEGEPLFRALLRADAGLDVDWAEARPWISRLFQWDWGRSPSGEQAERFRLRYPH
jgi:hypothetical protein